jgi:6-pyruvoyltetrahydropterin/6-carboxytetrahydropterin synthase
MIAIGREYEFAASHILPNHQGKCRRLHGHNYKVEVVVARVSGATINDDKASDNGMVMDFTDLDQCFKVAVDDKLDHQHLNDLAAFQFIPPTAENLVNYISIQLMAVLPPNTYLIGLRVWETSRSYAEWSNA